MTPTDKLAAADTRSRFAREVLQNEQAVNLARAALLIGAEEEPQRCDIDSCLDLLDRMGEEARERIRNSHGTHIEALNDYLFRERGFTGNEHNYYDPRNSMLHRVLERRTGIPITLSVVYIEVGMRAGLHVEGVGMPGHFIVRASATEGEVALVDPFNNRVVDTDECQSRLDVIYAGQLAITDEHLKPVGTFAILSRILGNLKAIYTQAGMHRRAIAVVDRILVITPHSFEERRDRGILLAELGRLPEAIAETRSYLNFSPNAPDAEEVREQLKKMQMRQAERN